jgi:ribose transport system substrate-binding protein
VDAANCRLLSSKSEVELMRRVLLALLGAFALLLAACGTDTAQEAPEPEDAEEAEEAEAPADVDPIRVGVANFTLHAPYFIAMDHAIADEAEALGGMEIIATDAGQDSAKLTSDVEDLIAQGVDGVIMQASPLESAPAVTDALEAAGIPLVLVNRRVAEGTYASWIGADNSHMGEQAGEFIVELLGGEGKLVVIRGGPADNTTGIARTEGMLSHVEGTDIEVVTAPAFGEWSEDGGIAVMEDMLAAHPDIDAVFCENDAMCLGAQRAIDDAGRSDDILLVGIDGQKQALEQILAETNYVASAKNDADEIGRMGLHRLLEILHGEDVEQDTTLQSPLITLDRDYLDDRRFPPAESGGSLPSSTGSGSCLVRKEPRSL